MGGNREDFILDDEFAHWIWTRIGASSRLTWPEDEKLELTLNPRMTTSKENYYRDGTFDRDDDTEWIKPFGPLGGLGMVSSPKVDFWNEKVREVHIAGVSYTVIGSWYTFEMYEKMGDPVEINPIRVPVTREMRDDVKRWAERNDGEMYREKGVEFKERYAEALDPDDARLRVGDLYDMHVRFPEVESEDEVRRLFNEATDFAERAVRKLM